MIGEDGTRSGEGGKVESIGDGVVGVKRRTSGVMLARKCPRLYEALSIDSTLLPESLVNAFALEEMERTNQMQFTSFLMLAEHVRQLSGTNPLALALNPLGAPGLTRAPLNPFNIMLENELHSHEHQPLQHQHQQQQQPPPPQNHAVQAAAVAAMSSQFAGNNTRGHATAATTAATAAVERDNRDNAAAAATLAAAAMYSGADRSSSGTKRGDVMAATADDLDERKRRVTEAETVIYHARAGEGEHNAVTGTTNRYLPGASASPASYGVPEDKGGEARQAKRPRLVWTPALHRRFVDAVNSLGMKVAVPKTIMQLMNIDGLTRENVASHLQKYRLQLKKGNNGSMAGDDQASPREGKEQPQHVTPSSPMAITATASAAATTKTPGTASAADGRPQPEDDQEQQQRHATDERPEEAGEGQEKDLREVLQQEQQSSPLLQNTNAKLEPQMHDNDMDKNGEETETQQQQHEIEEGKELEMRENDNNNRE